MYRLKTKVAQLRPSYQTKSCSEYCWANLFPAPSGELVVGCAGLGSSCCCVVAGCLTTAGAAATIFPGVGILAPPENNSS